MKIEFNDLYSQYTEIKEDLHKSLEQLFLNSSYINGPLVKQFEDNFAEYINTQYAIGVSNGTDAIMLAIKSLNLKNVIIYIPANTFISTILAAEQAILEAKIELIDCDDNYLIDIDILKSRLENTRKLYKNAIILPVHLYGRSCNMEKLVKIANKYDSYIIEDASQAHGAIFNGRKVGSFGVAAAFSLYPGKNLGAAGDAGVITTDCTTIYENIRKLRNLGSIEKYIHVEKGFNHRLDSLQASVVLHKLKKLDNWNKKRIDIANFYIDNIHNKKIILPQKSNNLEHVYHIFCIRSLDRNKLIQHLKNNNIEYGIHYPTPIEEMPMYKNLSVPNLKTILFSKQILSLPIHPFMTENKIEYVCNILNKF